MVNWGYSVLQEVGSFSCMTLPPKTLKSFTINSIEMLFYWSLMLSVTYFARRPSTWQFPEAGQQKTRTVTVSGSEWPVPAPARDGKEGSAQAEARSQGCLVVPWRCPLRFPLLSSPFSQGERPRHAGARAGGRRQNWRHGLKPGCLRSPGGDLGRSKSFILHVLLKGGCFQAHPCARWGGKKCPHMRARMAESTSAVVPGSSGSPHKQRQVVCSPDVYLLSGEEGWALAGQQSREINWRLRELIMSCGAIPYLVTTGKVAQSIKQPSSRPVAGWPQRKYFVWNPVFSVQTLLPLR